MIGVNSYYKKKNKGWNNNLKWVLYGLDIGVFFNKIIELESFV